MKASTCIQDPALLNCWQGPAQDASPKQHARQEHIPNHQQSSQRHPETPPHTALPVRGGKNTSSLQNAGTSPSQCETYTNHRTNLTQKGQRPKIRGTMTL